MCSGTQAWDTVSKPRIWVPQAPELYSESWLASPESQQEGDLTLQGPCRQISLLSS